MTNLITYSVSQTNPARLQLPPAINWLCDLHGGVTTTPRILHLTQIEDISVGFRRILEGRDQPLWAGTGWPDLPISIMNNCGFLTLVV